METGKKKLLIVHFSLYNGGAERGLLNFLHALPQDQYDVDLLLFRKEGIYLDMLPEYVRLLPTPYPLGDLFYNSNSLVGRTKGVKGVYAFLVRCVGTGVGRLLNGGSSFAAKQYRWKYFFSPMIKPLDKHYDVAMAYSSGENAYYVAEKVSADRKLAWVHNDYARIGVKAEFDAEYFSKLDGIATVSEGCLDRLKETFPKLTEKFVLLPNIVSEKKIRADADVGFPEDMAKDSFRIVTVGRLNAQKNPQLSVRTAVKLKERGLDFHWYWIGGGALHDQTAELIKKEKTGDRFHLLGTRDNPYPYIKNCDVFVQNSIYEGKSIAMDEAKILCRPIVATDYSTVHDQLKDDEGIIVGMTEDELADGIMRVLTEKGLAASLHSTLSSRSYGNEEVICRYLEWIEA